MESAKNTLKLVGKKVTKDNQKLSPNNNATFFLTEKNKTWASSNAPWHYQISCSFDIIKYKSYVWNELKITDFLLAPIQILFNHFLKGMTRNYLNFYAKLINFYKNDFNPRGVPIFFLKNLMAFKVCLFAIYHWMHF